MEMVEQIRLFLGSCIRFNLEEGRITAELPINDEIRKILIEWNNQQEFVEEDALVDGQNTRIPDLPSNGQTASLTLLQSDFQENGLTLYRDMKGFRQDMIRMLPPNRLPPSFVVSHKVFSEDIPQEERQVISDIRELYKLISSISDHSDRRKNVLFHTKKIVLDFNAINADSLNPMESLPDLIKSLNEDFQNKQRQVILKSTLEELLYDIPFNENVNFLVSNFETVYRHYCNSLELYLNNFSYGRFKHQFEKDNLDFLSKLSNVVQSLESQVIVISTSIIAASQINSSKPTDIKNFLIVIGILFAALLYTVIIRNQWVSRFQINSAIDSKRVQLESTVPKLYESELKCQFKELENRSAQAKRRLIYFLIIVWSNFSFSMAYFLYINRDGIIRMLQ